MLEKVNNTDRLMMQRKSRKKMIQNLRSHFRSNEDVRRSKVKKKKDFMEELMIDSRMLVSGSGGGQLYHEQYDEHGVRIENQCFT